MTRPTGRVTVATAPLATETRFSASIVGNPVRSTSTLRVGTQRYPPRTTTSMPLAPISIVLRTRPVLGSTCSRSVRAPSSTSFPPRRRAAQGRRPGTTRDPACTIGAQVDARQDTVAVAQHPARSARERHRGRPVTGSQARHDAAPISRHANNRGALIVATQSEPPPAQMLYAAETGSVSRWTILPERGRSGTACRRSRQPRRCRARPAPRSAARRARASETAAHRQSRL